MKVLLFRRFSIHLKITILLALPFVFSACRNSQKSEISEKSLGTPKEVIQVNWIGHWRDEGDKGKLVREIANEYEFLNPSVKVNLKFPEDVYYQGNSESEKNFIISQLQKEKPEWDIIRLYGYFPEIAKALNDPEWADKYLVDFSKVPGFLESHNPFMSNTVYQHRFDHKFFGPYIECQLAALFVNLNVAKKMGINVKQFGMTFNDFESYLKAAYEYNKTHKYVIPIFEYDWQKTLEIFKILFFSLMNDFEEATNPVLTSHKLDAIEKCYQSLEQLSKYEPIEPNWSKRLWVKDNSYVLKDSCLFFPNYTFMYNIWKTNDSKLFQNIMPCEFPVFKPSKAYVGGYNTNWAVLKNAPHKEEAIKLMMYWCKPKVADKWVRYTKSPSGVKGSFITSNFGTDPFENYSYMMDKKYGGNLIKEEDWEYVFGEKNLNKGIDLHVTDVLVGKMTAKEAFSEFKKKVVLN